MKKKMHRAPVVCIPVFVLFTFLFILLAAQFQPNYAQMPAHPELLKKIRSGSISMPSIITRSKEKESLGIDAPWTDAALLQKSQSRKSFRRTSGSLNSPSGQWNLLVIMTDFSDKEHHVAASYFDSLLFSLSPGSLKNYYKEISYSSIDIVTLNSPSSAGWIRAPRPFTYYISGGDNGTGTYPNNCQKLVEDIIPLVDSYVDFSKYDNDHNGETDGIMVIHSGKGAEYTGASQDIWSHAWALRNRQLCDGVYISGYSIQPEYYADTSGDMTIGVFAHELAHAAFGLPDLYDRDYSSEGLGDWSLMAGGSWNGVTSTGGDSPAHPDAWSRCQMGFIQPELLTDNYLNIAVNPIETAQGRIIKLSREADALSHEYYLVENRQKLGFDASLPGSGFLIYHIDEDKTNNDKEWYPGHALTGHYMVSLIQADNKWSLEKGDNRGDMGDPFSAASGKNNFSLITQPDSKFYSGIDSKIAVLNINEPSAGIFVSSRNYSLTISSPVSSDNWEAYSVHDICWNSSGSENVNIDYSTDDGTNWKAVCRGVSSSSGKYQWTVPNYNSSACRIKISDATYPSANSLSAIFTITGKGPAAVYPSPGDIIFTQAGSTDPDRFEFITLKRLNLTTLKLTDNGVHSGGTFASGEGTLDLSNTKYSTLSDVPEAAFIRFERGGENDDTDPSDRIVTFYYSSGPLLATAGDQLIAYTGTSSAPVFIASIDFGNSGWMTTGTVTSNTSYSPQTISDIYAGNKCNYRFSGTTDFNPDSTRDFIKNALHWEGSNSILAFTLKNIQYNPLPVELTSFSGLYQNGKVILKWETATEINNYGWQIEKRNANGFNSESGNTMPWINLAFVAGNGSSNKENYYHYEDNDASYPGTLSYRLKQIDNDGKTGGYSPEIEITVPVSKAYLLGQNYPNPFNSSTVIKYSIPRDEFVSLSIYNALGQRIRTLINRKQNAGTYYQTLNLSDESSGIFPSGVYIYELKAGDNVQTKKLLILK